MGRYGRSDGGWGAIFIYIIIIAAILLCAFIQWLCKRQKRQEFVERIVQVESIPVDTAKAIYDVNKAHKKVLYNEKYKRSGRDGELNKGRVEATQADDFYHIQRWIHRIENAKRCGDIDAFYHEIQCIVFEMQNRCNQYSAIKTKDRQRLVSLARAPEGFLQKYDNLFV